MLQEQQLLLLLIQRMGVQQLLLAVLWIGEVRGCEWQRRSEVERGALHERAQLSSWVRREGHGVGHGHRIE